MFQNVTRKEKNKNKKSDFLMFDYVMKNTKENQILLKLVKNLCIFKLIILYM